MNYYSTRSSKTCVRGSTAILEGLAYDGGLFVPEFFPCLNLEDLLDLSYRDLASYVLGLYFPELADDFKELILSYDGFSLEDVIEVKKVGEDFFLELYHGPTQAFKDLALVLLPGLVKASKKERDVKEKLLILTATSGDTGKAALSSFADSEDVSLVVFFPENGVSKIQKLQMRTQEGSNLMVVGIEGNFDDAQKAVKELSVDREFLNYLSARSYRLSSANSINIGRLIPQIIYYVYSYLKLVRRGGIQLGEEINLSVPTGNFGNILAGYYSKMMGLPVARFICASNDNKVLSDFFRTGVYDANRDLILTSSPSMDILVSSNLERLLYELSGRNSSYVRGLMEELKEKGYFSVELDRSDFYGAHLNEKEVSEIIAELFEKGYMIDPHTAVAYGVYRKYKKSCCDNRKTLIVSTASPFKFAGKVLESLGVCEKNEFSALDSLARLGGLGVPRAIDELRDKRILQDRVVAKDQMRKIIEEFLGD